MLTCVNPNINFKVKATGLVQQHKGVAVALKWLLPLARQFGGSHPPEDRNLSIGDRRGDKKQYFNKYADGVSITRGAGGVEVVARSCVVVKQSCFGNENWSTFCEGTQLNINQFHSSKISIPRKLLISKMCHH